jgi:hypothetical protein
METINKEPKRSNLPVPDFLLFHDDKHYKKSIAKKMEKNTRYEGSYPTSLPIKLKTQKSLHIHSNFFIFLFFIFFFLAPHDD